MIVASTKTISYKGFRFTLDWETENNGWTMDITEEDTFDSVDNDFFSKATEENAIRMAKKYIRENLLD